MGKTYRSWDPRSSKYNKNKRRHGHSFGKGRPKNEEDYNRNSKEQNYDNSIYS